MLSRFVSVSFLEGFGSQALFGAFFARFMSPTSKVAQAPLFKDDTPICITPGREFVRVQEVELFVPASFAGCLHQRGRSLQRTAFEASVSGIAD